MAAPYVAIADRGYDSYFNNDFLYQQGIAPVIHMRKVNKKQRDPSGIYDAKGNPTCIGGLSMVYVETNAAGNHLFQCPPDGCHLRDTMRTGIRHCDWEVWEDPSSNIRQWGGRIRRNSAEWKYYYKKRQAIERIFKSVKQSRRLEAHCFLGIQKIAHHALMSSLTYSATVLANLRSGLGNLSRWMVRKIS